MDEKRIEAAAKIPGDLVTRYELAKSQLSILPPVIPNEDDDYDGLRFQCEEVMELIERIGRAESAPILSDDRVREDIGLIEAAQRLKAEFRLFDDYESYVRKIVNPDQSWRYVQIGSDAWRMLKARISGVIATLAGEGEHDRGEWMRHDDYAALEDRADALAEAIRNFPCDGCNCEKCNRVWKALAAYEKGKQA